MKRFALLLILFVFTLNAQDIEEDYVQEIYIEPEIPVQATPTPEEKPIKLEPAAQSQPRQYFGPGPFFTVQKLNTYRYELVGLAAVLFYIVCYFRGKRANAELIDAFYQETQNYFSDNFSHIGFTKESNDEPFIGQSANEVLYYASGRNNCECMEINFNVLIQSMYQMRKRQDLISLFVYQLIWPEKDTITIDIPIKTDIPLVFLLSLKKKIKSYIEKQLDLKMLTGTFDVKNLHKNYEVLGQSADTVDQIFDGYVVNRISENPGLFMFIHYTDQKMFSNSTGHLRVVLNGAYKERAKYLTAMELVFHIVDKIVALKLSQNTKTKAFQAREAFNASKEKANLEAHREKLRKEKEDKLRKEEAWLKSLPPEKQKREDEKRKRKEFNKMIKGKSMKAM